MHPLLFCYHFFKLFKFFLFFPPRCEKWARDRHRQQQQQRGHPRMGADESKGGRYGLMGASAVVSNMRRMAEQARSWTLLHQCSLEQWKSGHAGN